MLEYKFESVCDCVKGPNRDDGGEVGMMKTKYDAFSRCHPAVSFLYFVGAIAFAVVIQHPAYMVAAMIGATSYYLLLTGGKGLKMIVGLLPVFVVLSIINPVFNAYGVTVLFHLFGRPYTFEALLYGMAVAGIFVLMVLWFGCYNAVLTSDKLSSLFGNIIPALSLLLIMVLRLIPNLIRKAKQIVGARKSIGKGIVEQNSNREKVTAGMIVLSALTDWALEGSIVTADSMRSRGYGTAKRTSFQIYRMTGQDWVILTLTIVFAIVVISCGGTAVTFTPQLYIAPVNWGFGAYCLYLLIPTALHIKETFVWHNFRSKI